MSEIEKNAKNINENNNEKKTCFIITPIGKDGSSIRRHIDGVIDACIKPVLINNGFDSNDIEVSHRMSNPGSISKKIIEKIYNSDLVIANLTELNPNVMYELALRHAIGKPVIPMAKDGTILPFDVQDQRTIFYVDDYAGSIELKGTLEKRIKAINYNDKSGPIVETLGAMYETAYALKEAEKNKSVNSDILSIIMNRLDKIENNIDGVYHNVAKRHKTVARFSYNYEYYDIRISVSLHEFLIENFFSEGVYVLNKLVHHRGIREIVISVGIEDESYAPQNISEEYQWIHDTIRQILEDYGFINIH